VFPVIFLRVLAFPVGFFYFLFSKRGRNESRRFLRKAAPFVENSETKKKCLSYFGPLRHIISFSLNLVEKLQSWGGKFSLSKIHFQDDDIGRLYEALENGKGVFLITSHLGNMELLRAVANFNRASVPRKVSVTAVMDMKVTENFSRMMKELNPDSVLDVIGVDEIGPDTVVLMEERLASGHMVTFAGDRTSTTGPKKNIMIPFLGADAPFSPGAFYLVALLKAPVFLVFALRRGELSLRPEYDVHVHELDFPIAGGRKERVELSYKLTRSFAGFLERYCRENPFQWYNFHDFWSEGL